MFFRLVRKNSKRSRKENGLFFSALIITIIAFYIILSLQNQDVILFLRKMESDALDKLFLMIPMLYAFSLFILFFLVYFAGKYQLERRSHELGMYMMLGMKRARLLLMLLAEDISNSILSLIIGIPAAVFLSEIISLITAKAVGLGIIGHKFSFSPSAAAGTVIGYFMVRLAALAILSGSFARKQITELLADTQEEKHQKPNKIMLSIQLLSGTLLLCAAYATAIWGNAWKNTGIMGITMILGLSGTFLFFRGINILFQLLIKKGAYRNGLDIFTFRQLQETVFLKSNSMAVSSLLVLMAICFFGYGIAAGFLSNSSGPHVLDYTFRPQEQNIHEELDRANVTDQLEALFEIKVGLYFAEEEGRNFSARNLTERVSEYKDTPDKEILLNNLSYFTSPYLISLSGYNKLLEAAGKPSMELGQQQAALYTSAARSYGDTIRILEDALGKGVHVEMAGEDYELLDTLCIENIVTDRSITISFGLVVTDEVFHSLIPEDKSSSYWNGVIRKDMAEEMGLMQAISHVNAMLSTTSLTYESYLQNMGRNLFYTVAASYTMIYLAVIFLVISNTVIGVQFLMQQRKAGKRYQTLISLGAEYKGLCGAAARQINWFFLLPVSVAAISSIFGIRSLFAGISTASMEEQLGSLMWISAGAVLFLLVIECLYVISVKRMSSRNIRHMMQRKRDDN